MAWALSAANKSNKRKSGAHTNKLISGNESLTSAQVQEAADYAIFNQKMQNLIDKLPQMTTRNTTKFDKFSVGKTLSEIEKDKITMMMKYARSYYQVKLCFYLFFKSSSKINYFLN